MKYHSVKNSEKELFTEFLYTKVVHAIRRTNYYVANALSVTMAPVLRVTRCVEVRGSIVLFCVKTRVTFTKRSQVGMRRNPTPLISVSFLTWLFLSRGSTD